MPTIFSHAVVPLLAGAALGRSRIAPRLAVAGSALAVLPDLDVIGFPLGIGYASQWGHRGFTHSLLFAAAVVGMIAMASKAARLPHALTFLFLCAASHPLLDLLTDGGQGVMLSWPIDHQRLFLDWQPIRVSPIGTRFFSTRGLETLWSELLLLWLPASILAAGCIIWRRLRSDRSRR